MNNVNFLDLSHKLIRIPSVKGDQSAFGQIIIQARDSLSEFKVEEFVCNKSHSLLGYLPSQRPLVFKVILNAHLDVVPGQSKQYQPFEKNGKLYGRGAQDMKAAAAVMIEVFKEVASKVNYPLGLQLVTDEEIGGFHGTKYQIQQGVRADFIIAGEPTDFGVNNQAKGIVWLRIKTAGQSAHGAYPWNGDNAIAKMDTVIEKLQQAFPVPHQEVWQTTANLATLQTSNQTFNKVPDECTLGIDIRYIPEDKDNILSKIKSLIGNIADIEVVTNEPCQFTDENNSYVKQLRLATQKITGRSSPVIVKHGGSDIRHFNVVGCDGVTFGPVGGGLHTDEEWVDIDSLEHYSQILKQFLLHL